MLLFDPLRTLDDLTDWVVAVLTSGAAARRYRYMLVYGRNRRGESSAWLMRTVRGPNGRSREDSVVMDLALAKRLEARWPVGGRTRGRSPQTARALLRCLAGAAAVGRADAAAETRQQEREIRSARQHQLREIVERIGWDGDARRRWEHAHREALLAMGGSSLEAIAEASDAGFSAVLALLAPELAAAEPWAERLREIVGEYVAARIATSGRSATDRLAAEALADTLRDRLVAGMQPALARYLSLHRWQQAGKHAMGGDGAWHFGHMGTLLAGSDEALGWDRPPAGPAAAARDDAVRRAVTAIRDLTAAELLTTP